MICVIILFVDSLLRAFGLEGFIVNLQAMCIAATIEVFSEFIALVGVTVFRSM